MFLEGDLVFGDFSCELHDFVYVLNRKVQKIYLELILFWS